MKRILALLLALVMVFALCACNNSADNPSTPPVESTPGTGPSIEPTGPATYSLNYAKNVIPASWNPHTYETADQSDVFDGFSNDAFYTMMYNDELHPEEGFDPYKGYVWVPAMAAAFPEDVTADVAAAHPDWVPEGATSGYAWRIALRDDLKWDDGTPIKAQDFVDSIERALRPELLNYRASDVYTGTNTLVNSDKYSMSGQPQFQSFVEQGTTYADFIANGGSIDDVVLDMNSFWAVKSADRRNFAPVTDDTMVRDYAVEEGEDEDYVSAKYLWDNYVGPDGSYGSQNPAYTDTYCGTTYYPVEAGFSFDDVGIYAEDDTTLVMVFKGSLEGYYLNSAINTVAFWLVKPDVYDANLKETPTASGSSWSSTYATSVETSPSYGPYKLADYQMDTMLHYVKNDNWYGWNYDQYYYVDPEDGETYQLYQTTDINFRYVKEVPTSKQMFLAGQLSTCTLQPEDFDQYRNSEYTLYTPGQAVFMLLMNGNLTALSQRENAGDFDKTTTDLQTQALDSFRSATNLSIDRDKMCAEISPANAPGFGLMGTVYVVDADTGELYRDTDQAKQVLCDVYNVDVAEFNGDLDAAVDSITGYDPETAKELYQQAFEEALELGYITDEDGDGKSDQTVTMVYAMSQDSERYSQIIDDLNSYLATATEGTPFEGKFKIVKSPNYGDDWSNRLMDGSADTQLAGWSGAQMDPYSFADTWTNPDAAYWGQYWDATKVTHTITVNGEDITMTLRQWAMALNGEATEVDGVTYNFGSDQADVDTRVSILASLEGYILRQHFGLPCMADATMAMHSQQFFYVTNEFSTMMGRGGVAYLKYNYSDADWDAYVEDQGGTLQY